MQDLDQNRQQQLTAGPISSVINHILLGSLRAYKGLVSPLLFPSCRFAPTCSEYASEAIKKYGPAMGLWISLKRILRCNRLFPGGYDPVP